MISLKFSETISRDNNLFRLPNGATSTSGSNQDTFRTDSAGFSLDKTYGLQAFHLGTTFGNTTYNANSFLNHQTKSGDAAWNWTLTPELVGSLTASRTQGQNSFTQFGSAGGSINTSDSTAASADFGGPSPIHLVATVSRSKSSNSVLITETGNTSAQSGEIGAKYLFSSGSSVMYALRRQQTDFLGQALDPINLFDTHASQTDHELTLNWQASAASTLGLVVTHLDKQYEHFQARNYSGTAGQLNFAWQPTAKTQVALTAKRAYTSWFSAASSYTVTDSLMLTPRWQISEKTGLHLSFGRTTVDYLGPIVPQSIPPRQDRTPTVQVGVDWAPLRNLSLTASWQREHRDSNQTGFDYSDRLGIVTATLQF